MLYFSRNYLENYRRRKLSRISTGNWAVCRSVKIELLQYGTFRISHDVKMFLWFPFLNISLLVMFCNPEQKLQDMNLTDFQHSIPNAKTWCSNKILYCIYSIFIQVVYPTELDNFCRKKVLNTKTRQLDSWQSDRVLIKMGLYWLNISLVFLIHLFLYAGVYCIPSKDDLHPHLKTYYTAITYWTKFINKRGDDW